MKRLYLKFNGSHGALGLENVAFSNWSVSFGEVGLQEDLEEIALDALDGVVDGKHVNSK